FRGLWFPFSIVISSAQDPDVLSGWACAPARTLLDHARPASLFIERLVVVAVGLDEDPRHLRKLRTNALFDEVREAFHLFYLYPGAKADLQREEHTFGTEVHTEKLTHVVDPLGCARDRQHAPAHFGRRGLAEQEAARVERERYTDRAKQNTDCDGADAVGHTAAGEPSDEHRDHRENQAHYRARVFEQHHGDRRIFAVEQRFGDRPPAT